MLNVQLYKIDDYCGRNVAVKSLDWITGGLTGWCRRITSGRSGSVSLVS